MLARCREVTTDARAELPVAAKAEVAVVTDVTHVPDLHLLTDGRFEAQCGKCLRLSVSVPADDAADAWGDLLRLGWSLYTSEVMAARTYAICPSCTANPRSIDDAVKSAKKSRKQK